MCFHSDVQRGLTQLKNAHSVILSSKNLIVDLQDLLTVHFRDFLASVCSEINHFAFFFYFKDFNTEYKYHNFSFCNNELKEVTFILYSNL